MRFFGRGVAFTSVACERWHPGPERTLPEKGWDMTLFTLGIHVPNLRYGDLRLFM